MSQRVAEGRAAAKRASRVASVVCEETIDQPGTGQGRIPMVTRATVVR